MNHPLVILDLDDTLYLERDFAFSGYRAVDLFLRQQARLGGFAAFAAIAFEQGSRARLVHDFLAAEKISDETLATKAIDVYRNHLPDIALCPDANDFLNAHAPETLAMITDGHPVTQWNKIRQLGLIGRIGRIIVTGDWGREFWKPHPRAYLELQGARPPEDCLYIADNPQKDFDAPAMLGWQPSLRIRRPGSLHYDLKTPPSCVELISLAEMC
jgi:putative hydrolase of the HAD superfamily